MVNEGFAAGMLVGSSKNLRAKKKRVTFDAHSERNNARISKDSKRPLKKNSPVQRAPSATSSEDFHQMLC